MKHSKLFLYISFFTVFPTDCMETNPLATQRIQASKTINDIYTTGIPTEFQATLIPGRNKFVENAPGKQYGFLTLMPYIGLYGADYPMRSRLALIQANPSSAQAVLPLPLKRALEAMNIPENAKKEYVIVLYGSYADTTFTQENIVLHPWAYTWKQKLYFSVKVHMGLFEPDGIEPRDLPVNAFKTLSVNPHNGEGLAFSPNNAKFTISPTTREVSSTWFAAVSPNKNNVLITFMVLANTENATATLSKATKDTQTVGSFLDSLENKLDFFVDPSRQTLLDAIDTIRAIALGQHPSNYATSEELKTQLHQLEKSLVNLQKSLLI